MDEKQLMQEHLEVIKIEAAKIKRDVVIMEICGGHTNVILKYGIRDLLPNNIHLISGPGCPVCVTAQHDIDCMIELANQGIPVATYGDMLRVPGSFTTLEKAKARTGNVFEIYSTIEVLELQKKYPNIVFFGIGFETTTPMTAFLLDHGVPVFSVHKLVPPVLKILAKGELKIDGCIAPGHVSAIIGADVYKDIPIPQVISGFSPERILRGIRTLVHLLAEEKNEVINAYPEVVNSKGNLVAQKLIDKNFVVSDTEWRGLGVLPLSGLEVRNPKLNAKIIYGELLDKVAPPKKTGCRCGDVVKGLIEPPMCPLYKKVCTPDNPKGACMVSEEGTCSIYYRYGK
jgi:hydrogenase expression/formation protein HypD